MYRALLTLLLTLLLIVKGNLFSQEPIVLSNETEIEIGKWIQVFHDSSRSLEIKDILKHDIQSQFKYNETDDISIPSGKNTFWIRFKLKNVSGTEKTYYLETKKIGIENVQIFTQQSSPLISDDMGSISKKPNNTHPNARFYYHKISLEPDEEIIYYFRINFFGHAKRVLSTLYSDSSYLMHIAQVNILSGLFYGMIFIFTFFILVAFFAGIKRRVLTVLYFNYVVTILFLFSVDGYGYAFNLPDVTWLDKNFTSTFLYLIYISFIRFSSLAFKDSCITTRRTCASLTLLSLIGIILLLIQLFFNIRYDHSMIISGNYAILTMIHLFVVFRKSKFKDKILHRLYYSCLTSMSLILIISTVYANSALFNATVHEIHVKVFTLMQFIFIAATLVRQISVEYRENEKASIKYLENLNSFKEKVNIKLENTVKERTNSLQEANRKLSLSLKRNNEITDELHRQRDEIDKKNIELEVAFKKSSAQHIRIQKAMITNMEQQQKLSASIETIQEKNNILELQNEEIRLQRERISEQNTLLEERARNIKDSMLYAERIQNSFFLPVKEVKKIFPESFIFLRPKEILSGDIYFVDSIEHGNNKLKLAAAVDCTGHGIPGALMSILANDTYHETLYTDKLTDPGQILSSLNQKIITTLNKDRVRHIDDGMDMSLIVVNYKTKTLQYAGARNPLYFFKNGVLNTQKGHICSVGTLLIDGEKQIVFPTHSYSFEKGDIVYLFSDGYADQFGGKDWSKFKRVRFQNLLSDIHKMPMDEQLKRIESVFNEWKGDYEQIDDVLVIGIRL